MTAATGWLAAQNPPPTPPQEQEEKKAGKAVKKVPVEEEELPKAPRPKAPVPVDGNAPAAKGSAKPAADPASADLAQEAEQARQPALRDLFAKYAHPFDRVTERGGTVTRIYPYLRHRNQQWPQTVEVNELNSRGQPALGRKIRLGEVEKYEHFEEVAVADIDAFLKRPLDSLDTGNPDRMSRTEHLVAAEMVLASVLRAHESLLQEKKRTGRGWDKLKEAVQNKLIDIRRAQLRALLAARDWTGLQNLAARLGALYADKPEVQQEIYRAQVSVMNTQMAKDAPDSDYVQLRELLSRYEGQFPAAKDKLVEEVRDRLRRRAEDLRAKSEELVRNRQEAAASDLLRVAQNIDPNLRGLQELRGRLRSAYQILAVGVHGLPQNMSPATARTDAEKMAVELLFEGLLDALPDPTVGRRHFPSLALAMPEVGPLTRDFQLVRGASWGDRPGEFVTAQDVKGTLELLQSDAVRHRPAGEGLDLFEPARSITITDPFRIRLMLRQGRLDPLGLMTFKILPAQHLANQTKGADDGGFARQPFGSGPYLYKGVRAEGEGPQRREFAVFEANPAYGRRPGRIGQPTIKEVRLVDVSRVTDPAADFRDDRLHLLPDVPTAALARYRDGGVATITAVHTAAVNRRVTMLAVNHRRGPLQNRELRRGMAAAIDRETLLTEHFRDGTQFHRAMAGPFPPTSWATPKEPPPLFNADLAKGLLGQAVDRGNVRLTLKFPMSDESAAAACQRIKEQVEKASAEGNGPPRVEIVLEGLPAADLRRRIEQEHDYDLAYYNFDYRDDLYWLGGLLDPTAAGKDGRNVLGYLAEGTTPDADDRRLAQLVAEQRTHRDFKKELLPKAHQVHKAFNDTMPFIPLWQLDRHMVTRSGLEVYFPDSPEPVPPALLPPGLFKGIARWKLGV
jgi:ABC-type transport system substrate-binding protein